MSIFQGIDQFGSLLSDKVNSAFDSKNHGFLSGNWDDFQLGINRVAGLVPNVVSNNIDIISKGVGKGLNNTLTPLSYNPSFYLIAGGSILALLIIGYGAIKVGKYI